MNASFRDFVTAMQSCAVASDTIIETQESVRMIFDRDKLETLAEALEDALIATTDILDVLPDECTVTADVDYFLPTVAELTLKGQNFPTVDLGSDVIALQVALDDVDTAVGDIMPDAPIGGVQ